jgi:hypothetical protein
MTKYIQSFYLKIRRCLLHPFFADVGDKESVETMEGYLAVPSCKINSLVEILSHHLAADNASGIEPSRQRPQQTFISSSTSPSASRSPSPSPPPLPSRAPPRQQGADTGSPPDKIIIYSFFPTSFPLIKMVSCAKILCTVMRIGTDLIAGVEPQQY